MIYGIAWVFEYIRFCVHEITSEKVIFNGRGKAQFSCGLPNLMKILYDGFLIKMVTPFLL